MDLATIIGLVCGMLVITSAIVAGGGWQIFIHLPSLGITIGGMLCATMIHFSLGQFLSVFSIVKKTIVTKITPPHILTQKMVDFAAINRRDGALALEQEIHKVGDAFFGRGLQMLVDGQEPDNIREILEMEIQYLQERHGTGKKILEFMGAQAPAFGMIGTLIGLIQMLRSLSSPDAIGGGMAVALITTFYGAFSSNLFFIPMAGKLGIYSQAETTSMQMIVEGICAIARGDSPTAVKEKMHVFISKSDRRDVKAKI